MAAYDIAIFPQFFRNFPQFSAIFPQFFRNFSQLDSTPLDRNFSPPLKQACPAPDRVGAQCPAFLQWFVAPGRAAGWGLGPCAFYHAGPASTAVTEALSLSHTNHRQRSPCDSGSHCVLPLPPWPRPLT